VLDVKGAEVNSDERNLLSVAFKNLISFKRAACHTIAAIEQNPKYAKFSDALAFYKTEIEEKLTSDCQKVVDMINEKVLAKHCDGGPEAFFVKMVGDYYCYIAENAKGAQLEQVKQNALKAFEEANKIALPPWNPIKLGLALNFSVIHYEVIKQHSAAC
jgi:14-3-3 protein epsilon